jgi:acetyl esterase/lipase
MKLHHLLLLPLCLSTSAFAQAKAKKNTPPPKPTPTIANLPYGDHERQVVDFYRAKSEQPTPLVYFIHGGGWMGGDKSKVHSFGLNDFLANGISVAAMAWNLR